MYNQINLHEVENQYLIQYEAHKLSIQRHARRPKKCVCNVSKNDEQDILRRNI